MNLSPGFDLAPEWLRRLRLLDLIREETNVGREVDADSLARRLPTEDAGHAPADLADLAARGWVARSEEAAIGGDTLGICRLLPEGADFLEDIRETREDTRARRRAARDAVLQWLYAETCEGRRSPVMSDFAKSPYGLFYGHPFTEEEADTAAAFLKDEGYLTGTASWGHGIPRPAITTAGERVAESGRSVNAEAASPGSVHIHGSHNVLAMHGSTASQTVTVETKHQALQVSQALRESLDVLGLDPEDATEAGAIARELDTVASAPSPDPGRLAQLLTRARDIATSGTAQVIGGFIATSAAQALQQLG